MVLASEGSRASFLLVCLRMVQEVANRLAPRFLLEMGRIVLLAPQDPGTRLVGVALLEADGSLTELSASSSGPQRWVALIVELARSFVVDLWPWRVPAEAGVGDVEDDIQLAREIAADFLALPVPAHMPGSIQLVVADEPELHLHPAAQEDVAKWAVDMSIAMDLLVATHAPAFLRLSPTEAAIVRVARTTSSGTQATRLDGGFLQNLDALAADIGLGRDRLLQLVRGLVVVEGKADAAVLRAVAGRVLSEHRLELLPIGGHSKSRSFADGDLAIAVGLPVAAMFDDTTPEALAQLATDPTAKVADEVRSLSRLLSLTSRGLSCVPLFFDMPDVIGALPEGDCPTAVPPVPGLECPPRGVEGSRLGFVQGVRAPVVGTEVDRRLQHHPAAPWSTFGRPMKSRKRCTVR